MTMLDRLLPVVMAFLTIVAVISAAILVRAALVRPYIGALVERATVGALIAGMGVISSLLLMNATDRETGLILFRLWLIALLAVPSFWTWLWYTGRLGGGK